MVKDKSENLIFIHISYHFDRTVQVSMPTPFNAPLSWKILTVMI